MVEINTKKMIHFSDRIKSQIYCLNDISSDLYLWLKSEQNADESDAETVEAVKRQSYEIDQTIKELKKMVRSIDRTVLACVSAQHKASEIVESVECGFSGQRKENLKMNDLTAISEILADYKFNAG